MLLFILDNKYLAAVHEKSFALQLFQFSHSQKLGARKFQSSRRGGRPIVDLSMYLFLDSRYVSQKNRLLIEKECVTALQ